MLIACSTWPSAERKAPFREPLCGKSVPDEPIRNRDDAVAWIIEVLDSLNLTRVSLVGMSYWSCCPRPPHDTGRGRGRHRAKPADVFLAEGAFS